MRLADKGAVPLVDMRCERLMYVEVPQSQTFIWGLIN